MKNTVFYSLNEKDLQRVAVKKLKRKLNETEIVRLKQLVSARITWYEAISDAIREEGLA